VYQAKGVCSHAELVAVELQAQKKLHGLNSV
jgi:hypothetical protein